MYIVFFKLYNIIIDLVTIIIFIEKFQNVYTILFIYSIFNTGKTQMEMS